MIQDDHSSSFGDDDIAGVAILLFNEADSLSLGIRRFGSKKSVWCSSSRMLLTAETCNGSLDVK